jgi:hypothetical protein
MMASSGGSVAVEDDADDMNLEVEDFVISDYNDVIEGILRYCPRLVWLVVNDNHEQGPAGLLTDCYRPDMCVSYYLKIQHSRLTEILEPYEWRLQCNAFFRPNEMLKRGTAYSTRPIWILVDPSGRHPCRLVSPGPLPPPTPL